MELAARKHICRNLRTWSKKPFGKISKNVKNLENPKKCTCLRPRLWVTVSIFKIIQHKIFHVRLWYGKYWLGEILKENIPADFYYEECIFYLSCFINYFVFVIPHIYVLTQSHSGGVRLFSSNILLVTLFVTIVLILLPISTAEVEYRSQHVVTLTDQNFDELVPDSSSWMLKYRYVLY